MDYFRIFLASLLSITALFISAKIIGNKQMSQLNMFDYINGITIGSIAADMSINLDNNIWFPIIAIIVYTLVIALISRIGSRSLKARRFFTGKSIILMDNGKLFYDSFKTAKLDLNEFLTQCRINGFYNPSDIETAVLEQNGMISFLPKTSSRPVTPKDLSLTPNLDRPFYCIISDGVILTDNLKRSGMNEPELSRELKSRKLELSDIFAGFYNGSTFIAYPHTALGTQNDMWQ